MTSKAEQLGAALLERLGRQAEANRVAAQRLRAAIWAVMDARPGLCAYEVRERLTGVPRVTLRTIQRHMQRRDPA